MYFRTTFINSQHMKTFYYFTVLGDDIKAFEVALKASQHELLNFEDVTTSILSIEVLDNNNLNNWHTSDFYYISDDKVYYMPYLEHIFDIN